MIGLPHTCTLQKRHRNQKLTYTGATGTAVVGQTVTGATSHKTAVIRTLATGHIVVKTVTGTFTPGEALTISPGTFTLTSQYPTAQDDAHVKATTVAWGNWPYLSTDPTKSLIGTPTGKEWSSDYYIVTNQRFHIDLGSAKVITRIYYENSHYAAGNSNAGVRCFTFWGTNDPAAFAEVTYGVDTGWTQLPAAATQFDPHVDLDQADPKYITITNAMAYRYFGFKFADNWGRTSGMQVRRIELQALVADPSTWTATLGTQVDYQNQSEEYEYYWSDDQTSVPCRFYYSGGGGKGVIIHETGQLLEQPLKCALPSSCTVDALEYRVVSTVAGFTGTYTIATFYPLTGISSINHYEAILRKVTT